MTDAIAPVALAVVIAGVLDRIVGEPPDHFHPVALFGRIVDPVDRDWEHPLLIGVAAAIALPTVAAILVGGIVAGTTWLNPYAGVTLAGLALFSTTSLRMLLLEAGRVVSASDVDPEAARETLPALAGRDPDDLTPGQLRSAAVESAAENLSDGLVAPLFAFSLVAPVSLSLGAAAAAWVKGVNTMDSMLGYPDRTVGTPAARLDDVVMWLPARVSALLLSVAAGSPDPVLSARRWAAAPASPNAGWPMGTIAGTLRVRLEKPGAYKLNPLADLPTTAEAERGIDVVGRAGVLAYGLAALAGVIVWY